MIALAAETLSTACRMRELSGVALVHFSRVSFVCLGFLSALALRHETQ
jgi:hypothetical protein